MGHPHVNLGIDISSLFNFYRMISINRLSCRDFFGCCCAIYRFGIYRQFFLFLSFRHLSFVSFCVYETCSLHSSIVSAFIEHTFDIYRLLFLYFIVSVFFDHVFGIYRDSFGIYLLVIRQLSFVVSTFVVFRFCTYRP